MIPSMAKKDTGDPVIFAHAVLDQIISKHDPKVASAQGKDPKKVTSGIKGGSKGGHARAGRLSAKKRKEIAKKAAKARWNSD
jgi:hypothetical protein